MSRINRRAARSLATAAALCAIVQGVGCESLTARASELDVQSAGKLGGLGLVNLEELFWRCDFRATTYGPDHVDFTACSAVYEAVKARKFAGDFNALVVWWRDNKPIAHQRLVAAETPAVASPTLQD